MPRVSFHVECDGGPCQDVYCAVIRYVPGVPVGQKEVLVDYTDSAGFATVVLTEGYCEWEVEKEGYTIQTGSMELTEDTLIEVYLTAPEPPPDENGVPPEEPPLEGDLFPIGVFAATTCFFVSGFMILYSRGR